MDRAQEPEAELERKGRIERNRERRLARNQAPSLPNCLRPGAEQYLADKEVGGSSSPSSKARTRYHAVKFYREGSYILVQESGKVGGTSDSP